mgnify:CR=1 FL=1
MYFKFKDNDIYRQTIIAYPTFKFTYILSNEDDLFKIYLNNSHSGSGKSLALDSQMRTEINVNRTGSELVYPFIDKTSGNYWTSNITSGTFDALPFGTTITGTYMVKPVLFLDFISSTSDPLYTSLVNIWETQKHLSKKFEYENFPSGCAVHIFPRDYYGSGIRKGSVRAIVTSVFEGAVTNTLNTFIAQDIYKDGILRVVEDGFPKSYPVALDLNAETDEIGEGSIDYTSNSNIGSEVGYVLYDYGLVLFKSSSMLYYTPNEAESTSIKSSVVDFGWSSGSYGTSEDRGYYNWRWFGDPVFCKEESNKTFASLEFQATNKIQNITMMCHSPKTKLNNSTNPTFVEYGQNIHLTQSSAYTMMENSNIRIKNIVSSSYNVEEEFDKRTIISTVFVLDENKKILGIAKIANPIIKKEGSDNTFKISLDL